MNEAHAHAIIAALESGTCTACKRTNPPGGLQLSRVSELICVRVGSCLDELATQIINQHERKR